MAKTRLLMDTFMEPITSLHSKHAHPNEPHHMRSIWYCLTER